MNVLKILLVLICLPLLLYLHLFFEYFSSISIFLVLSVFIFRDLKLFGYWWCIIILTVFIDSIFYYWLGTYLLSTLLVLVFLEITGKFISNLLLDLVCVFLSFVLFRIFFYSFVIFQEAGSLDVLDINMIYESLLFALTNLLLYLFIRLGNYILDHYFRNEGYKI